MIARVRAWLDAPRLLREELDFQLSAAADTDAVVARLIAQALADRDRIAELEKQLSTEQHVTAALDAEVKRLVRQNNVINLRADAAIAEAARVRADAMYVAAERCECGGDTELHWRKIAATAERDRANAVRLTDELERMRARVDEADRVVHIAEQLGRAR